MWWKFKAFNTHSEAVDNLKDSCGRIASDCESFDQGMRGIAESVISLVVTFLKVQAKQLFTQACMNCLLNVLIYNLHMQM